MAGLIGATLVGAIAGLLSPVQATTSDHLKMLDMNSEEHDVMTEDEYLLKVFRIPNPGSIPVLLLHGFMSSSDVWVLMQRDSNLATILADNNYDVWMMNARGNLYSHKHARLSTIPSSYNYWNFSVHEIGTKDLPAVMDHIQKVTGHEHLLYLGHSLGTTAFMILCSEKPTYCSRFASAVFLAPVAFPPDRIKLPVVDFYIRTSQLIAEGYRTVRNYEFLGQNQGFVKTLLASCSNPDNWYCQSVVNYVLHFDRQRQKTLPKPLVNYVATAFAGTSLKVFEHITSIISSNGKFAPYDKRGPGKQYYIENITVPIAVFHATDDTFIDEKSMRTLRSKLKSIVLDKTINVPFKHMGYMFDLKSQYYIADDILSLFNQILIYFK